MDLIIKKRLAEVLASYGADPGRWPAADRDLLAPHLDEAAVQLAEARDIDRLLNLAVAPPALAGFEARLMARIDAGDGPSNVVALTPRAATPKSGLKWLAALPLAASLALGLYLGAQGRFDSLLPSMVTGTVAQADDDTSDPSGVTEVTDYSGDQVS
jgi:hypothetical protein